MDFKIVQAERRKVPLRMLLSGPPGCGKTLTSLRIAKGIENVTGFEPVIIDSENRSALHYACNPDEKEESGRKYKFNHLDLYIPTIENFITALEFCKKQGYKNVIVDSITHEWLDLLEKVDEFARDKYKDNSFRAWGEGTPLHRRFIMSVLTYPGHIICTCRSKIKYEIVKLPGGGMKPKKVGLGPEQRSSTEYEFSIHFEGDEERNVFYCSKDRTNGLFQNMEIEKPDEEVGMKIINWLLSGSGDKIYIQEDPELLEYRQTIGKALHVLVDKFKKEIGEKFKDCNGYENCTDHEKLKEAVTYLKRQFQIVKNRRKQT